EPAGRLGGGRAVRADLRARGADVLRARRRRRAGQVDVDGAAHVGHVGAAGAVVADGARVRGPPLRAGGAFGARGGRGRLPRQQGDGRVLGEVAGRVGFGADREHGDDGARRRDAAAGRPGRGERRGGPGRPGTGRCGRGGGCPV